MKKVQALDEYGRNKAVERYGELQPKPVSEHGHSHMDHNMAHKFDSDLPKEPGHANKG